MKNKITLITPPDFFENESPGILLIDINSSYQEQMTEFLTNSTYEKDLNIYFYMGENDPKWLLYALSKAKITYVDIDNLTQASKELQSYILGKATVFYSTHNPDLAQTLELINKNRVPDLSYFLENQFGKLFE